ncbi:MAG: DUF4091 domain-containing protein [Bacilli bacterium]|nr:DUF4091 domain-containing protein [Bacilli bacterium]
MKIKNVSSLEKVFENDSINKFEDYSYIRALKNEIVSYQIVLKSSKEHVLKIINNNKAVNIRLVGYVPSNKPIFKEKYDQYYITDKPGLFPDVLYEDVDHISIGKKNTVLWISFNTNDFQLNKTNIEIDFCDTTGKKYKSVFCVDVIDKKLPQNDLIYSDWLYADCIANYYNIKIKSKKHWEWIEKYISKASSLGINMIITPLFTLPLDTEIGGERSTFQLVGVEYVNGKYIFDFSDFERWIMICKKYNIHYYEMGHLFTQWGAKFCPKIEVKEDNRIIKKFGWNVLANSKNYKDFLSQFLPKLDEELIKMNIDKYTYFHISDEPGIDDIDNYKYAYNLVNNLLHNKYKIIDALSNVEFYDKKIISNPVPATSKYDSFFDKDIAEKWCYYCGYNSNLVSNRLFSMPSYRNRIFGIQLYYLNFSGFLHWGFNFYNSQFSKEAINPFLITDGKEWVPSGDAYIVYPGEKNVLDSIRGMVFLEGLQDRMLLRLLEKKIGFQNVKKIIEKYAGDVITFKKYPHDIKFISNLRNAIIDML